MAKDDGIDKKGRFGQVGEYLDKDLDEDEDEELGDVEEAEEDEDEDLRDVEEADEDDEEWLNESNSEEAHSLLSLIEAGFPSDWFNTFDWVKDMMYRLYSDDRTSVTDGLLRQLGVDFKYYDVGHSYYDSCSPFDLESLDNIVKEWVRLRGNFKPDLEAQAMYHQAIDTALTPVESFLNSAKEGSFPEPEILLSVAKCFQLYFLAGGRLTLEDVFFGAVKQKGGNYAARRKKASIFVYFHEDRLREIQVANPMPLVEHVRLFLRNMIDNEEIRFIDDDSFVRSYRRWLKRGGYRDGGQ
ncbi:hypothetical protein QWY82_07990 [Simiduia curdlanivorans]|uniref:Uncharacterized protein n=1 Tax=Simiduia curdlanivorans TaxID=1492769 RepID=A0ABV8V7D3_9GAMM|nr:hypothetical protein [Simiduia curdlanivorans]MDN3638744.1 hypothetical protein [Simiduia curdlanivorans]